MHSRLQRLSLTALFASLPMVGAVIGAAFDQRHHQGFTTWRAACGAAGLRFGTLIDFTLQLLPTAIIGLLLGGLVVLAAGALAGDRHARTCIAAHAGCALTLPVALILCAFLPPLWMLAADAVIGVAAASVLMRLRTPSHAAGAHP
jgi:hypothetical protein